MIFELIALIFAAPLTYVIYGLFGRKRTVEELHQKTVLITGCGGGFGKQLVERCLKNGMTVFAGCLDECSVLELKESYDIVGGQLHAFQMDVSDEDSVRNSRKLVDNVLREKNLVLHAVVNNAGIRGNQFYDDFLNLEDYQAVWDVNTYGVIRVIHTFRDLIKQSNSSATLFPIPGYGPYASSKQAVEAYADVIRHELRPYSVQVIVLEPGSFESGMQDTEKLLNMMDSVWNRGSEKIRDEFGHDYIVKAKAAVKTLQSKIISKDSIWVIDTCYEAIVAKRPKLLYRIGWDALLFYMYSFLPLRLKLYIVACLMYLNNAPLPAKAKTTNF